MCRFFVCVCISATRLCTNIWPCLVTESYFVNHVYIFLSLCLLSTSCHCIGPVVSNPVDSIQTFECLPVLLQIRPTVECKVNSKDC